VRIGDRCERTNAGGLRGGEERWASWSSRGKGPSLGAPGLRNKRQQQPRKEEDSAGADIILNIRKSSLYLKAQGSGERRNQSGLSPEIQPKVARFQQILLGSRGGIEGFISGLRRIRHRPGKGGAGINLNDGGSEGRAAASEKQEGR